jgi:hypothetical protein
MLGIVSVLLLLALPRGEAAAAPAPGGHDLGTLSDLSNLNLSLDADGACDDEEMEPQELLECGSQYDDMLDAPRVLLLLRALDVRLTKAD